jgi:hypothetical protein
MQHLLDLNRRLLLQWVAAGISLKTKDTPHLLFLQMLRLLPVAVPGLGREPDKFSCNLQGVDVAQEDWVIEAIPLASRESPQLHLQGHPYNVPRINMQIKTIR